MAPELRDLLDRSVAHPPAESHPVGEVVRRAHRSRRRHRALRVGGSVLAVVVVVGLVSGVTHGRFAGDAPVAQRHTEPVDGSFVRLSDAVAGVAGRDYTLVSTLADRTLEHANGRQFRDISSSGEVLVAEPTRLVPSDQMSEITLYAVLSPATGRTTQLPEPPDSRYTSEHSPSGPDVETLTDDTVVWIDSYDQATWRADLYDRAAGTWTSYPIPVGTLPHRGEVVFADHVRLAAGRLWFTMEVGRQTQRLWSMPADGSSAPRSEGRVGVWDIDGDTLVTTDRTNAPATRLTVRDLATGTRRDLPLDSACNEQGITVSGSRIGLREYCGSQDGVPDNRAVVLTDSGDHVVTIQGAGVALAGLGDGIAMIEVDAEQPTAGSYVYDVADERLVRLSSTVSQFGAGGSAGGSTLTWSTPINDRRGAKMWAASWR